MNPGHVAGVPLEELLILAPVAGSVWVAARATLRTWGESALARRRGGGTRAR